MVLGSSPVAVTPQIRLTIQSHWIHCMNLGVVVFGCFNDKFVGCLWQFFLEVSG